MPSARTQPIRTCVRIRPLTDEEVGRGDAVALEPRGAGQRSISVHRKGITKPGAYRFHRVFGPNESNQEVYDDAVKEVVQECMSGMNCTLVAYGQHGSGKTYSMVGASGAPGMAQCAARDMFEYISQNPDREFLLRVSMCEVRRNAVHDLLKTPALVHHHQHQHQHQPPPLAIRADSLRGTVVDNLSEVIVTSPAQILSYLARGNQHREAGAATENKSHTVFSIIVESRSVFGAHNQHHDDVLVSTLTLVDLAGSNCSIHSSQKGGMFAKKNPSTMSSRSLSDLRTWVHTLVNKRPSSVKLPASNRIALTQLMFPSIAGNARTVALCTVSPSTRCLDHSLATIDFAHDCTRVQTKAMINRLRFEDSMIAHHKRAIANIERRVAKAREAPCATNNADIAADREKLERFNSFLLTAKKIDDRLCAKSFIGLVSAQPAPSPFPFDRAADGRQTRANSPSSSHSRSESTSPAVLVDSPADLDFSSFGAGDSFADSRCATPNDEFFTPAGTPAGTPFGSPWASPSAPHFSGTPRANRRTIGGPVAGCATAKPGPSAGTPIAANPARMLRRNVSFEAAAAAVKRSNSLRDVKAQQREESPKKKQVHGQKPKIRRGGDGATATGFRLHVRTSTDGPPSAPTRASSASGTKPNKDQAQELQRALQTLQNGVGHDGGGWAADASAREAIQRVHRLRTQMQEAEEELARLRHNGQWETDTQYAAYGDGNQKTRARAIVMVKPQIEGLRDAAAQARQEVKALEARLALLSSEVGTWEGAHSTLACQDLSVLSEADLQRLERAQSEQLRKTQIAKAQREAALAQQAKLVEKEREIESLKTALAEQDKRLDHGQAAREIRKLRARVHDLERGAEKRSLELEEEKAGYMALEIKYHRLRGQFRESEKALAVARRKIESMKRNPVLSNRKNTPGRKQQCASKQRTPLRGRQISDYSPVYALTEKLVSNPGQRPSDVMDENDTGDGPIPEARRHNNLAIDNNRARRTAAGGVRDLGDTLSGESAFENMDWGAD